MDRQYARQIVIRQERYLDGLGNSELNLQIDGYIERKINVQMVVSRIDRRFDRQKQRQQMYRKKDRQ